MKLYVCIACLLLFGLTQIVYSRNEEFSPVPSTAGDFVNQVMREASIKIQSKYRLYPYGTVISMPGDSVCSLGLAFQARGALSKEIVRAMLVDCAQILLQTVLDCEGIKPFLHDPNFDIKNVRIILYIVDSTGRKVYDPQICVGDMTDAILIYRTDDRENEHRFKNRFEESYEDALKAMRDGAH